MVSADSVSVLIVPLVAVYLPARSLELRDLPGVRPSAQ